MARVSAVQSIVESIKRDIPAVYAPGSYLPNERDLADRFEVSRNTVREAIIFLEAYGFVEKTQKGPKVTVPDFRPLFQNMESYFDRSIRTFRDLLQFRRCLDMGLTASAVQEAGEEDLARMVLAVERMQRSLTVGDAAEADYEFHYAYVAASGNTVVEKMYKVMRVLLIYNFEIGKDNKAYHDEVIRNHYAIIDAIRKRSHADLLKAVDRHFSYSQTNFDQEFPLTDDGRYLRESRG